MAFPVAAAIGAGGAILSSLAGRGGSGQSNDKELNRGQAAIDAQRLFDTAGLRDRIIQMLTGGLANPAGPLQIYANMNPSSVGKLNTGMEAPLEGMQAAAANYKPGAVNTAVLDKFLDRMGYDNEGGYSGGRKKPTGGTPSGNLPSVNPRFKNDPRFGGTVSGPRPYGLDDLWR